MEAQTAGDGPIAPPLENQLLRARAQGEISADAAFEKLYLEYGSTVYAWLALRADRTHADDLAQDVWLIFYGRWRRWRFGTEAESEQARPVLSFLFRTCSYVAKGFKRRAAIRLAAHDDAEAVEVKDPEGEAALQRTVEANRILSEASRICSGDELDVLLGKLAGLSGRDLAAALEVTESVVDHRYRAALGKLRKAMKVEPEARRSRKGGRDA